MNNDLTRILGGLEVKLSAMAELMPKVEKPERARLSPEEARRRRNACSAACHRRRRAKLKADRLAKVASEQA